MAVVNTKSTSVTNADNTPPRLNDQRNAGGAVREHSDVIAAVSGDSIGSTYRFSRVRSSDRVSQILLNTTAITTCAGDVGLYRTARDGGAVVDADFFASAQSLATALANSDVTYESGVVTVANRAKPIWQQLGLASDPKVDYDIVVTLTAAAGSAGDIELKSRVVTGN